MFSPVRVGWAGCVAVVSRCCAFGAGVHNILIFFSSQPSYQAIPPFSTTTSLPSPWALPRKLSLTATGRPTRSAATSSPCITLVNLRLCLCRAPVGFFVFECRVPPYRVPRFAQLTLLTLSWLFRQIDQRKRVRFLCQAWSAILLHHRCRTGHQGMGRRCHQDEPW